MMTINWKDYITIKECAELTGKHYQTIYHYVTTGVIPAKLFNGRFWRIHQKHVKQILEGNIDVCGNWTKEVKNKIKKIREQVREKTRK